MAAHAQAADGGPLAVSVEGVSKRFRLPTERMHTLKERVLHPRRSTGYRDFRALDGVSFDVRAGEFFGIVGRNGSGKSTLLKCMAGIYGVDAGEIRVAGRVSPFIELGVGFNPDLTARENVVINAVMLGLTPREARRRFDEVIAFAELEEFVDLKLKNYSSGMHVRLAFAVMVQAEADILLIDEVLAVGDAAFQQKCYDEFERMQHAGRTILFVTHSMSLVERFCDRALLLERGKLHSLGDPAEVATLYNELNFGRGAVPVAEAESDEQRPGDRSAEVVDARFESAAGERIDALAQGEPCRVVVEIAANETVRDPIVALELLNEDGLRIFATNTNWLNRPTGTFEPGERAVFTASFEASFAPGRYRPVVALLRHGSDSDFLDRRAKFPSLLVHGVRAGGGLVDLPHEVGFERADQRAGAR
jgi:ABC-type polysaccharide/polyol phosphate transport system ATPase subunit